jgi:periplasmic protein TonB
MIFTRVVSDELAERAGARAPRHAWHRARSLPAVGMPFESRRRRVATFVSILLHFAMIWVLLQPDPVTNMNPDLEMFEVGAGGPGPAGGGGGGTRGTGGVKYVQVAPPTAAAQADVAPVTPSVQPVIETPKPVLPEIAMPQLELPKASVSAVEVKVESPIVGTGGGTGNDGTRGNGPGTGGGVGSGIGTGRGSGIGPGTGGGKGDHYPPDLIEMPIMPLPVPAKLKGTKVVAVFDVDEKGKVVDFEFTPTRDGDYNRKLRDLFRLFKFRPGTTLAGVPIRSKYPFEYEF